MAIDTVVEEVADNLEELAETTRRLNTTNLGYALGGAVVGLAIGFYFGHRWNKEKIKAEAFKQSEEEVEQIRSEYRQKIVASQPKPAVEELIEEKGYERPLPPPVPVVDYTPPVIRDIPKEDEGWDWEVESAHREETSYPFYVLHQSEFGELNKDGYSQVTYTYYAGDGVLTDEDETQLPIDRMVGTANLKFGHGADDEDVVFVRNTDLQIDMEICRTPKSWEEEVLGVGHDEPDSD